MTNPLNFMADVYLLLGNGNRFGWLVSQLRGRDCPDALQFAQEEAGPSRSLGDEGAGTVGLFGQ